MRALIALAALAACQKPPPKQPAVLADPVAVADGDPVLAMKAELADQILSAYEREEPPDLDTAMLAREPGPARIGVGPGDVLAGFADFAHAPASRWPLYLGPAARLEVRSKRLAIELAADRTAAWVSDEVSQRITACGHTAVIPMRVTQLYAHDGDRWVPAFEHVSFARTPAADPEGLVGKAMKTVSPDRDLSDALSRAVARTPGFVADRATLIGPGATDLWQAPEAIASLPPVLVAEDRRIGLVGRSGDVATVAYWVGNFTIDAQTRDGKPAGRVRVRGTFVFQRQSAPSSGKCGSDPKSCRWLLVQAHVSQPIKDADLARAIFGVSLVQPYVSDQPLSFSCD